MSEHDDDGRRVRSAHLERLGVLEALCLAFGQPHDVFDAVADAETLTEAAGRVSALLGIDEIRAQAVVNVQLWRFTRGMRQRVIDERDEIRELLDQQ